MSTYRLTNLLHPRSVAVIGASPRAGSVGRAVLNNLRGGGFEGPIGLVNPHRPEVDGFAAVRGVRDLAAVPELIVVTAPPARIADIIDDAARAGVAAAIVVTAGLGRGPGSTAAAVQAAARPYGLRLVGPNCLGTIVPSAKLNASFAADMPRGGDLALISQSGAVGAAFVQWAVSRSIGISAMVSIGDAIDVDFGDLLDYFALDRGTRAILLYVESIADARKFMSAARAAARSKPVLVIKSGRHQQGARAAATHTGALAGSDAVYDAAFRRAGLLRAFDLGDLFAAAETLAHVAALHGNRLAILTNGGGLGVLAVDRLVDLGGTLATLSPETMARLDAALPPTWSKANPVDIIGDADPERYEAALDVLLDDPNNDAVLVINLPTALASPIDCAKSVIETKHRRERHTAPTKPLFSLWLGTPNAAPLFEAARIPQFDTESEAILGFMHLVRHREVQAALMQTPPNITEGFSPDVAAARSIVARAIESGAAWLDPLATARLLAAYDIPVIPTALARNAAEAAAQAARHLDAGTPVAIKILSPDIVHKSDVGGVVLNLAHAKAVREAAAAMLARVGKARPDARIDGVIVQPMILKPKARELIAGIADDQTFGPVIVFGRGGTAVEVIDDKALALPPLDLHLAQALIGRTRVSRILRAYRDVPAADVTAIALVLVKLAQLAADLPDVKELDLNPLIADHSGVIAVDARIAVAPCIRLHKGPGHPRFAVQPYPTDWVRTLALADGTAILVRPVRAQDEDMFRAFFTRVSQEDLRLRFFAPIREFSHAFIARLTQIDYSRAMALVAIEQASGAMLGAVRLHVDSNFDKGEYAILVRSDLKGRGLGWHLMQLIIAYARSIGLRTVEGQVLRENRTMLEMCRQIGFTIRPDPSDATLQIVSLALPSGSD
jgi:acetyltransferase